jgi:hypothetical protein
MFPAWEVSPYWLLDEWMSSVDFLQVRRVERAAETRRIFCFWLATGLSRHARRRGNMCLSRHPLRRGSPANLGATDGDLHPALPRHKVQVYPVARPRHKVQVYTAWRGGAALPRRRPWRGRLVLPRHRLNLNLGRGSILVFVKLKRGKGVLPRQAPWRGNVKLPRRALWRGRFNP